MTRTQWRIQVKVALLQHDMTQTDLASELGVTRGYLNQIINDTMDIPARDTIKKISARLGVEEPGNVGEGSIEND